MEDFAEMAGVEYLLIDKDTTISQFKKELHWNTGTKSLIH
jgi:L-arabinose isomerase